ncbi:ATP-binding protein [Marinobacterium marinum]|uniref:ATP-binding protein n=1 Tax=Marinobacterium marinum TaxID=2756129 RepID=A0A7W2ACK3_9GAMM|nr:ATP-binding protein [Marinobacterium marinum]MBA4503220.1 ATP-binding protein [Marinobacterium marinum]
MIHDISTTGILISDLKIGVVSSVAAQYVKVNLAHAGEVSGHYMDLNRYGKGEVGELVLIEAQQTILLGRIIEISLPDRDRSEISQDFDGLSKVDAIGIIRLLGSIHPVLLKVQAGISAYPRLGDRIFSAPGQFVSMIPLLTHNGIETRAPAVSLELGVVSGEDGFPISVTPERLFGRHCAILGSTGGGKSWTTAKIIQECRKYRAKIVLLDATSEYRSLSGEDVSHCHLGAPLHQALNSIEIRIPPSDFNEGDFIALFQPSGKTQGPKLREAIKSLRLAKLAPELATDGYFPKVNQPRFNYRQALNTGNNAKLVDNPAQEFDVSLLVRQVVEECCFPEDLRRPDHWGGASNELSYCSSLLTRILGVIGSTSLSCVFSPEPQLPSLSDKMDAFLAGSESVLRICMSSIGYEFGAREVIANAIGRMLLHRARDEAFRNSPLLVILDEAHNFLGKSLGEEDYVMNLDAFELIAKEGRKYGLNICLATQRPRDITEGVLSQMGTLLVHRLTNDRDREVVERACGEIDRSAAAFLPNLKQGEVAMVGVDFPIPVTIQIDKPTQRPYSDGPSYQELWGTEH